MLLGLSNLLKLQRALGDRQLAHIANCAAPSIADAPNYTALLHKLDAVRKRVRGPLTLTEKILYSHLHDVDATFSNGPIKRGQSYLQLIPERVAMQDASAQMAILQFMSAGLPQCLVPTSIHCDHLIQAIDGADSDLKHAMVSNKEVFDFLESAAKKYGIEFWRPGSGIIHQIVLENYASPGMLMLGTDSHTPNAGGLGTLAIGVGGADAVDAMTGTPWELKAPRVIGIHLTGGLTGWATPKDLILYLIGKLTVKGGTGCVLEYFGPGVVAQSGTGLATVANMGAEVGATSSIFPYTGAMRQYLHATRRSSVALAADEAQKASFLIADEGAEYDEVIHIDLSEIEPMLNGPFTPDISTPISDFATLVSAKGWQDEISGALIGSCTNSSYEDMTRAVDIARQAEKAGLKAKVPLLCTPGSEQVRATMERDGLTFALESAGAVVLANACGPCIGQWKRPTTAGKENAILTSFNRNFRARNDGNHSTMNFLASPAVVIAKSFSDKLSFNPLSDSITTPDGKIFIFSAPNGADLPTQGFTGGNPEYYPVRMPVPEEDTTIVVSPNSSRLQLLDPFPSHFGADNQRGHELASLTVLMRIRGKCTTDHISAAGPWLKYKGHLENISQNLLITAVNDEGGDINVAHRVSPDAPYKHSDSVPRTAQYMKNFKIPWMLVVDENYGEGSAREHAALQPRYYGCALIVARSFARIHETNLKKQGVLPLWFADKSDYHRIGYGDQVETHGVKELIQGDIGATVCLHVTRRSGDTCRIRTTHTMSKDQLAWFRAGSALNHIRAQISN